MIDSNGAEYDAKTGEYLKVHVTYQSKKSWAPPAGEADLAGIVVGQYDDQAFYLAGVMIYDSMTEDEPFGDFESMVVLEHHKVWDEPEPGAVIRLSTGDYARRITIEEEVALDYSGWLVTGGDGPRPWEVLRPLAVEVIRHG